MKRSTKDQIKGKAHEIKGGAKEKIGRMRHSPALKDEGANERAAGKAQKKIGQVEKVFEE